MARQTPEEGQARGGDPELERVLQEILHVNTIDDVRSALIDVEGAQTVNSDSTKSRSCLETTV